MIDEMFSLAFRSKVRQKIHHCYFHNCSSSLLLLLFLLSYFNTLFFPTEYTFVIVIIGQEKVQCQMEDLFFSYYCSGRMMQKRKRQPGTPTITIITTTSFVHSK